MDIQFHGGKVRYFEQVLNTTVLREETGEIIVPDALPDISEIVGTVGQAFIRGKDVGKKGAAVSGVSEVTVLYRDEEGNLYGLPAELPFEAEAPFGGMEEDARVTAALHLANAEARLLNSRKLLLRCEVSVTVTLLAPREIGWAERLETSGCRVESRYAMETLLPVCQIEEKTFTAEETLPLPAGKPTPETLLYALASLNTEESSAVGQKLVVRGTAGVTVVYLSRGGEVAQADFRLPWSAFLDLPEGEVSWSVITTLTGCSVSADEGGFSIAVGGVAQAVIRSRMECRFIDDAYGTDCEFTPVFQEVTMETEERPESISDNLSIRLEDARQPRSVLAVSAEGGRMRREQEHYVLPVSVKALCLTVDGTPAMLTGKGEVSCPDFGLFPDFALGDVYASVSPAGVEIRVPLTFNAVRRSSLVLHLLTGGEAAARAEREGKPTVTLLRAAPGDTVWSLGKRKGVSGAAIRSYNHLAEDEEPAPGSLLLLAQ